MQFFSIWIYTHQDLTFFKRVSRKLIRTLGQYIDSLTYEQKLAVAPMRVLPLRCTQQQHSILCLARVEVGLRRLVVIANLTLT